MKTIGYGYIGPRAYRPTLFDAVGARLYLIKAGVLPTPHFPNSPMDGLPLKRT
jgi:hypothetical protein